jgi:hypothetical protein
MSQQQAMMTISPLPANRCRRIAARLLRRGQYQQAGNEYWRAVQAAFARHPKAYRKALRMMDLCERLEGSRGVARSVQQ